MADLVKQEVAAQMETQRRLPAAPPDRVSRGAATAPPRAASHATAPRPRPQQPLAGERRSVLRTFKEIIAEENARSGRTQR